MDFRILGSVEARADGRALELAGPRQRAVLALLLLRGGGPVTQDRLVDDLWGEESPAGAVKTLHVAVSRLRRALGAEGGRLVSTPAGYKLSLEAGELDLERFESLCEEGRRALRAGMADRAAARLGSALAEWRGPPLADLSFEPFAQAEVAHLEDLRAAALEDRIEADLQLGRHSELVAELETLVARDPMRERLRGQLMLALYRVGRQGDALEAYSQAVSSSTPSWACGPGRSSNGCSGRSWRRTRRCSPRQPVGEAPVAERRRTTATILFTDLAGSTPMRAELGDEAADVVRREHDRRVRDVLTLQGGREVKTLGDGFLALFESAGAAVAAAVDMQRAIDRQADRGRLALGLRVGIAAGDVAHEDGDVFGMPVVEAQRLCASAAGGRILVSDAVRLLAGADGAGFEDAGELQLRGIDRPVHAWAVPWLADRTVTVPLAAALAVHGATTFAGREAELGVLTRAWSDVCGGRRRGVLFAGEPGIGKTRLAAEMAAHALGSGGLVLYGRCDDGLTAAAQPFAEALSAYVSACPPDELRVQLGARAADLMPMLPALGSLLPGVVEPAPAAPEAERLRMLEATAALLEAAGSAAPVLLVLDDLHWADELTLHLLRHLLRADAPMRVLVLASYRDTEPSRSTLLADVVTGLARRPDVERLELGPLAEQDVAAILAGAGREPSLAARVRATTEGNPFFVGEVVRALGEDGDPEGAVTPRARDVVRGRLARLPAGATEVLIAAAVTGAEFDVDVLAGAAGVDVERALDALEAAESARLVRPSGDLDRFSFAHALVRQTIVGDLPAGRRVRLHARVAHALEQAAATRAVPSEALAEHFDAAGSLVDPAAAREYARAAGDEAAARLAFDVAAEQYARAVRAHARLPAAPVEQRLDLELARGRALRLAGDERAHEVLRRTAADAEAAGDGGRMADALLTIGLGHESLFLSEDHETIALLRRALALLPPEDSPVRARLLGYLALESLYSVPDAERHEMVARALAMARRTGDAATVAAALDAHAWTAMGPERRTERLALAEELVAIAPPGSPYAECHGHVFRYLALVEGGDARRADTALAAARAAARVPVALWTVTQWEATRALLAGELADAEAKAVRGAEAARDAGFPPGVVQATFTALFWCIRLVQGRLSELEPFIEEVSKVNPGPPVWLFLSKAQVACEKGDAGAARGPFESAVASGLLEFPRTLAWLTTIVGAADVCASVDDRSSAARLYELLEPCADVMAVMVGPVGRAVGRLATTLGRRDEAERRHRAAVALCERMDARAYLADRPLRPRPAPAPRRRGPRAARAIARGRGGARHAGLGGEGSGGAGRAGAVGLRGVAQDGGDDEVPCRSREVLVPRLLEGEQLGAGDLARQRLRMGVGERRVLGAVGDRAWGRPPARVAVARARPRR